MPPYTGVNIEPVPSRKKLGWFSRVVFILHWFTVFSLILAFPSPWINPANFWPVAFFGLAFPGILIAHFLFTIYWFFAKRKFFWINLTILLVSLYHVPGQFQISFRDQEENAQGIKVMSWNVKLFDLYNWTENLNTRAKMFDVLQKEKADIICLQEFYTKDVGAFRNFDTLKKILDMPNAHSAYTISLRKTDHWGIVTYSRYPIINQGRIVFNNRSNNICIYSDHLINDDTVRVYNMHLQSISFGYADLQFMRNVIGGEEAEDELTASRNIIRRMKRAYEKRAGQARSIAEHIRSSPYPVIVCGDFNDTPNSYTTSVISSGLRDAFKECGSGFGKTYVNPLPLPRIDYILYSDNFKARRFLTLDTDGMSDHYPIISVLSDRN